MIEFAMQELVVSLSIFILVQGIILVNGVKKGDPLLYYIPATAIGGVALWISLVLFPGVIP